MTDGVFRGRALRVWVVLLLVVPPLMVLAAGLASASVVDVVSGGSVSVGRPVADGKPGGHCSEDSDCFNSCTMGVNGEYPESDARYWVPGPCDITSPLPYGGVFQLVAVPVEGTRVTCAQGQFFARVTVMVVGPDTAGDVRAQVHGYGCARQGDPFADFAQVLPGMYREAARQLDV